MLLYAIPGLMIAIGVGYVLALLPRRTDSR